MASGQSPDDLHISQILDIIFSRSFHDTGQVNQKGMVDDVREPFKPDIPLSNMPVSIYMPSQRGAGIVEMDQVKFFQSDLFIEFRKGSLETLAR